MSGSVVNGVDPYLHGFPMRRLFLLLPLLAGCAWTKKPYAGDPLVRQGQAVIGDPTRIVSDEPWHCPCPPEPPVEASEPLKLNERLKAKMW